MDRRPVPPHAASWEYEGGAYRDGDQIVLPGVGAAAQAWIPAAGITAINFMPLFRTPAGQSGTQRLLTCSVADAARGNLTSVGTGSNARSVAGAADGFVRSSSPVWPGVMPAGTWAWIRMRVSVTASYGTPGTRYLPDPYMWWLGMA